MSKRTRVRPAAVKPTQPVNRRGAVFLAVMGVVGASAAAGGIAVAASRGSRVPASAAPESAAVGAGTSLLVVDKPLVDLGRVPLDVAVPVSVTLTNRSDRTVRLGKPIAEILEGC